MSIVELSISNWNDEVLLADTLVIIEFWHDTCGWCKRLEPIYGTPTLMFFCEARSVGVLVGFQPQDRLIQQIEDMLNNYQKCLRQSTSLTPKN
jgi:thioredoxin-like negative regulator of GroEL